MIPTSVSETGRFFAVFGLTVQKMFSAGGMYRMILQWV